ncbi:MAG: di-trans,poly-cis-decaprenylcistransferase [Rhodospirillales bacterium]|nr:di-trans,poly-cis-decaprenylcistransferase [Rhodospirillales bacterium]
MPIPHLRRRLSALLTGPLYRLYERHLLAGLRGAPMPRHVGIILDGNRRYGRRTGLTDPSRLYRFGAHKLDDVLEWCGELAIPAVTLWVCSTDNLERAPAEVAGILEAVGGKLQALAADPHIARRGVRVQAIGRLDLLPAETRAAIAAVEAATAGNTRLVLTIAIAYGGREEIADAVRAMLTAEAARGATLEQAIAAVSTDSIARHLYLSAGPELDLIIRTSGELRLSGFLLWHSAYSEFHFTDVLWPAFRKIDFLRAVRAFQDRRRRFGK